MVAMLGMIIPAPLATPAMTVALPACLAAARLQLGERIGGHDRLGHPVQRPLPSTVHECGGSRCGSLSMGAAADYPCGSHQYKFLVADPRAHRLHCERSPRHRSFPDSRCRRWRCRC